MPNLRFLSNLFALIFSISYCYYYPVKSQTLVKKVFVLNIIVGISILPVFSRYFNNDTLLFICQNMWRIFHSLSESILYIDGDVTSLSVRPVCTQCLRKKFYVWSWAIFWQVVVVIHQKHIYSQNLKIFRSNFLVF